MPDGADEPCGRVDSDQLLEEFESRWDQTDGPDIVDFVRKSPADDEATIAELIQIDLERRWRTDAANAWDLPTYLARIPLQFSRAALLSMIAWEYEVRSLWGDCPSRKLLCERHPELHPDLLLSLEAAAASISWPRVEVVVDQQIRVSVPLDRRIAAGRQTANDASPWSVRTESDVHQIVLSPASDATLSRSQLQLRLTSPTTVRVRNSSSNRALATHGQGLIAAGTTRLCRIPLSIHLGRNRQLRIISR